MVKINVNNINNWTIKKNIKDEKHFAIAITAYYKMSNTKHKTFVNCPCFDVIDIEKRFNLKIFLEELKKLNFSILPVNDKPNIFVIIKNDETRELKVGKLLLTTIYE